MATSSSVVDVSSFSTDAKFRTWGSAVSAAIVASGLTVTSDTGQINWTTVLRATTANVKQGYEVYRFNDSLQSTAPIFLRIDYGSLGNSTGTNPGTWLTVGTGTDGAGNVTGAYYPVTQIGTSTNGSTNTTNAIRASYSASAGAFFLDTGIVPAATNQSCGTWLIQRTCDSSGNPTGSGLAIVRFPGSAIGTPVQTPVSLTPVVAFATRNPAVGVLNVGSTSVSGGGVIELYRSYVTAPTPFGSQGSVAYLSADIVANATFSAAPWVGSHTYLALGTQYGPFEQSGDTNICAAVIWE